MTRLDFVTDICFMGCLIDLESQEFYILKNDFFSPASGRPFALPPAPDAAVSAKNATIRKTKSS